MSRRALFGLGVSRALDELPVATARPAGRATRPAWSDLLQAPDGRAFGTQLDEVAGMLADRAGVVPGQGVIDIGAADGSMASALRARGADVDHAPRAVALPYADDSFDAAVSAFGVIYTEQRGQVIGELFRLVRPGGVVALACWTRSGFMGRFLGLVAEHAWPPGAPDPTVWGRQERLRQDLEPYAGEDVEFDPRVVSLEFASPATAWSEFAALPGPVGAGIQRLRDGPRERLEAAFHDLLPEPREGGGVTVDVRLQLVVARAS